MRSPRFSWRSLPLLFLSTLPARVLGGDVLTTAGFSTCVNDPTIQVTAMDVTYTRSTQTVVFNVAGSSSEAQNVTAKIIISAYGRQYYEKTINPCDSDTYIAQLCPVPAGNFAAQGNQVIPDSYTSMIPSIVFQIPDLDGIAKLELLSNDDGVDLACISSTVSNGKSTSVKAVTYAAAGMMGATLAVSAVGGLVGAAQGAAHTGASTSSPSFGEVFGWFQGIATNGMLSVSYPSIYVSFAKNFGFSTGMIPWGSMQTAIDNFRSLTGGNLTADSWAYLQNSTLVDDSTSSNLRRRALGLYDDVVLYGRDLSLNGTQVGDSSSSNASDSSPMHYVHGIEAYVEKLSIPASNSFMTILLMFAIVIAGITVGILLLKVILEALALMGNLPKSMNSFRKRYWWRLAKTITNLVMLLYGSWTLYCVYQWTSGDSWAAKTLAAVSWVLFTSLLGFFAFKIWSKSRQFNKMDGDSSLLYEHKETWIRYSLFYDNFKKGYWWIFIPTIIYTFAKNTIVAAADGHGLVQSIGQIAVEVIFLGVLLWARPYNLKSGNVINITIQVVRVISVVCVLVFVDELGINQTAKTVTGLVLIVVQSLLTGALAVLIGINAIITCVRANPHRQRRKEAEKLKNRDLDDLTPLDARNSLLMDPTLLTEYKGGALSQVSEYKKAPLVSPSLTTTTKNKTRYDPLSKRSDSPYGGRPDLLRDESQQRLVSSAASMGSSDRSSSPERQPQLPNIDVELGSYNRR